MINDDLKKKELPSDVSCYRSINSVTITGFMKSNLIIPWNIFQYNQDGYRKNLKYHRRTIAPQSFWSAIVYIDILKIPSHLIY